MGLRRPAAMPDPRSEDGKQQALHVKDRSDFDAAQQFGYAHGKQFTEPDSFASVSDPERWLWMPGLVPVPCLPLQTPFLMTVSKSTAHRRFLIWSRAGVWGRRTTSWLTGYRRLDRRYERHPRNYLTFSVWPQPSAATSASPTSLHRARSEGSWAEGGPLRRDIPSEARAAADARTARLAAQARSLEARLGEALGEQFRWPVRQRRTGWHRAVQGPRPPPPEQQVVGLTLKFRTRATG